MSLTIPSPAPASAYNASLYSDSSNTIYKNSLTDRWTYSTSHLDIDLGARISRSRRPTFGLNGHVEGFVRIRGNPTNVKSLSVALQAQLATSEAHPSSYGASCSSILSSQTTCLYDAAYGLPLQEGYTFEFHIPAQVEVNGAMCPTPPSFSFWDCGMGCDVTFTLKVNLLRKRYGFEYNESRDVDILCTVQPRLSDESSRALFISPASYTTFTSGETISFVAVSSLPHTSTGSQQTSVRITLYRRVVLCRPGGKSNQTHEVPLASGVITSQVIREDGSTIIEGRIKAGSANRETSWNASGAARVEVGIPISFEDLFQVADFLQYVLKLSVDSPKRGAGHRYPVIQCEQIIGLTTDVYGADGIMSPAFGLEQLALPRDDCGTSTRFTGV
ncbi:hypothetical protein CPB85DRAFT_1444214 [Mucidula mucida]|nr:hypothetical protein CPB85DRAFT_1444214 [Mucidula mucida]